MDLIDEKDFDEIVAKLTLPTDSIDLKETKEVKVREAIKEFKQELIKEGGQHKICIVAARHGYTDMLKAIKSKKLDAKIPFDERVSSAAAFNGHLLTLKWLKGNGCICDADTCKSAVEGGQKEVLEWGKKSGCPWDYRTTEIAAQQCNVDILKWAIENGCEWDPAIWSTMLNIIRSRIKADIKIAEGKRNNTQPSTERKWRPLFDIFFWADEQSLFEKSDGLIKCLRFFRFCTYKMRLKLLKKRHHEEKYVKAQKQWEDLTLTVKAVVDGNSAPFYWSVAKKKFDFYVDNNEYFDNSDIYKNDDKIMSEIITSEEDILKKSEDEILKLTEVHLQTKGLDDDHEPNGNEDIDTEDLKVEGTENKEDADGYLDESDMRQFEEDVSNGSLEFTSQVQNW